MFKMRVKKKKEYKDKSAVLSYISVMDLRIGLWLYKILELKALPYPCLFILFFTVLLATFLLEHYLSNRSSKNYI